MIGGNPTFTGYLYFKPGSRDEMHYPARINVKTSEVVQNPPNAVLPMFVIGVNKLKLLLGDEMYSVLMERMQKDFSVPADVLVLG